MNDKYAKLLTVSDPTVVAYRLNEYIPGAKLYLSSQKNKKYAIRNPVTNRLINFGDIRYEDYTYHQNPDRRNRYLQRSLHIRGNWKNDKYSPNQLSTRLLW